MSKFVKLMGTDIRPVCVNLDNVQYAIKGECGLNLILRDNKHLSVLISLDNFYDLATGKSK